MSKPPGPKGELDPHPPQYRTPVPSLPRDPRLPSDIDQLIGADARDTDRMAAASGEHEVNDAEKTPAESPYTLKRLSEKMDQALEAAQKAATSSAAAGVAARDAANNSVTMMSRLDEFARELKALAQRVTALEISRQWAPLLIASIAVAFSFWLTFRMQDQQRQLTTVQEQVRELQRILEP